jgi:hypothetical protein
VAVDEADRLQAGENLAEEMRETFARRTLPDIDDPGAGNGLLKKRVPVEGPFHNRVSFGDLLQALGPDLRDTQRREGPHGMIHAREQRHPQVAEIARQEQPADLTAPILEVDIPYSPSLEDEVDVGGRVSDSEHILAGDEAALHKR